MVSASGKHEPSVISSHILQSAFLAEERDHPQEDDWKRSNIPCRVKNILRRLKTQDVPHTILSGHTAFSGPRQLAVALETQRLIDYTVIHRKGFCFGIGSLLVLFLCFIAMGFWDHLVSVYNDCDNLIIGIGDFVVLLVTVFSSVL